jgi:hypothetical protein
MGSSTRAPETRVLLGRILGVLGVASLSGCAARTGGDGATEETGSSSGSESESESSTGSMSSTSETDTGDDGPILDINDPGDGDGDGDGDLECSELVVEYEIQYEFVPPRECLPRGGNFLAWANVCFFPPEGETCETEPFSDACIIDAYSCGLIQMGDELACGPFTTDAGACCYVVWGGCAVGRPWIVNGHARRAALEQEGSGDWAIPADLELATLDVETRAALADAWASEGLSEHASVAAFTRFTLQLLALGTPSALVEASIRAGRDEVRHARACFALASAYAGSPVGPGPLDIRGGLDERFDLDSVAQTLAAEGCIAETVSLSLLAAARDRARNPTVRAMLAAIVEEEEAHVLLAWEALAWMCRRGTSLSSLIAVFRDAEQHVGFGATTERPGDAAIMREHGYLSVEERREIASLALARVVGPAARELFMSLGHQFETVPLSPAQRR